MIIDSAAKNPAFSEGRLPTIDLDALLAQAQQRLDAGSPWRLISARKKLGKTLFEVEAGGRRLIGIAGNSPRMEHAFRSLELVWSSGMRPPQLCTVVEPVGWLPESRVILMEKAPGELLWPMLERGAESALERVEDAAQWLVALHALPVEAPHWEEDRKRVLKWSTDLVQALPEEASRVQALRDEIISRPAPPNDLAPSHGDFHGGNVFVEPNRITVIDLDKFGLRERAFDVAYCLVQTACMGFWAHGEFASTERFRSRFLEAYERLAGVRVSRERISLHMGATLLQNLNYDLTVFKTGRVEIAPIFLAMAERCIFDSDIALCAEAATMS